MYIFYCEQVDVFADVEPLVGIVAEGKNACVISYGDTQAGKLMHIELMLMCADWLF